MRRRAPFSARGSRRLDVHSVREATKDRHAPRRAHRNAAMRVAAGDAGSRGRGDQPIGEPGFTPLAVAASGHPPRRAANFRVDMDNLSSKASKQSIQPFRQARRPLHAAGAAQLAIPCSISATVIVER